MPFSLKSNLSYSGLSAAVEDAAFSAYSRIRSYMEEMPTDALTIVFLMNVRPTPDGKKLDRSTHTSLNHEGLGAYEEAAAIDNYRRLRAFMDDVLCHLVADVSVDLTMTVRQDPELPSMIVSETSDVVESAVHDAKRRGYASGYAFADQKWTPVYKAVCEELAAARKELSGCAQRCAAWVVQAAAEEADLRQKLDEGAEANEKLEAQVEELRMELASAKGNLEGTEVAAREVTTSTTQVVEGLRKELTSAKTDLIRAQHSAEVLKGEVDSATVLFQAMRSDLERLNAENKEMELAALILSKKLAEETASSKSLQQQIVEDKQMVQRHLKEIAKENAEATAWEKEEIKRLRKDVRAQEARVAWHADMAKRDMEANVAKIKGLEAEIKGLKATQWRPVSEEETVRAETFLKGLEAKGTSSPRPPAIVRLPPLEEEDKERAETFLKGLVGGAASSPLSGLCCAWPIAEVEDQPTVCGTAGCIECPAAEAKPVAKTNYNHPNWPSPITKRFAKHLATHSGQDPKAIRTHQDALEYIANRSNISVETLLQWTMKHYQSFSQPWTLVEGPHKFHMGTAPATWWC